MAAAGAGLMGLGKTMKGIGGTLAMLAGVSMTIGQLVKWEQMAEDNIKAWQPLQQRTGMDRATMTRTGLGRGYNSFETQSMLDVYTQTAGNISQKDAGRLMDFSRGYGVDASTAAGMAGQMSARGYGGAGQVLDMAAGVASSSGMEARILEVLETSSSFLQSMDKNLKDNSGNNLLAYTARINQIGQEKGAQKLTGHSGASILEQMGSNIFNPSNVRWQAMGINLLQRNGGKATEGMNTFDLMKKWQEGFSDPVNMKVLGKYLQEATEGMSAKQSKEYKTLVMQEAMGGGTTLKEAEQFGELTDWLKSFDPANPKMASLLAGGNAPGNGSGVAAQSEITPKAASWQGTLDAKINIANAAWMQAQLEAGEILIPTKLVIQDFATDLLNDMTQVFKDLDIGDILADKIKDALGENLWETVGLIAGGLIAAKIGAALLKKLGKNLYDTITGKNKDKTPDVDPDKKPGDGKDGKDKDGKDKKTPWWKKDKKKDVPGTPDTDPDAPKTRKSPILGPDGKPIEVKETAPDYKPKAGPDVKGPKKPISPKIKGGLWGLLLSIPAIASIVKDPQGTVDSFNPEKSGGDAYWNMANLIPGVNELTMMAGAETDAVKRSRADAESGKISAIMGPDYYNTPEMQARLKSDAAKTPEQKAQEIMFGSGGDVPKLTDAQVNKLADYLAQSRDNTTKAQNEAKDATTKAQGDAKDGTVKAQSESRDSVLNTNKEVKTSIDNMVLKSTKTIDGMKTNADTNIKTMETNSTKIFGDWQIGSTELFSKMQTDIAEMTKNVTALTVLNGGGGAENGTLGGEGGLSGWLKNFNIKDPSTWFGGGGGKDAGTLPKSEIEKKVYAELEKQGKGDWWGTTQKLISKESSWNPTAQNSLAINPRTGKADKNGERAAGLFQFLPSTWKAHMPDWAGDDPRQASIEHQTDAFIRYVEGKYGDVHKMADKRGLYGNNYKGYADGTFSAMDQIAKIHAGEEIISRAKTGEVQRKTGLLPSQVLNQYMSNGGGMDAPRGTQAASAGGTKRIVVDVNLNGGEALSGVSVAMLEQIARQVFEDAAYQSMRQNVVF